MTEIFFLGTGASVPSRERGLPAMAVRFGRDIVLFDCGEGTQRQFMVSPLSFMKVKAVFVTHLHGDHFLGLPGLLLTMGLSGRSEPLRIVGPQGTRCLLENILGACGDSLPFDLAVTESAGGESFSFSGFCVTAFPTRHGVPSVGFLFSEDDRTGIDAAKAAEKGVSPADIRLIKGGGVVDGISSEDISSGTVKGIRIVYTGDTLPCDEVRSAAMGADVLVHEATFGSDETESAGKHNHATSVQAAEVAKECGVRMLVLNHVSNRYKDRSPLLEEAAAIFPDTMVAEDFLHLVVTRKDIRSV
ncbi:MAG: ribonuclease Z [Candidatus Methanomethylophilaceae archaeon]|jgi:ribonuclease Z|nr:ribonuclease Z [Candidatus Methanomethylophilaceae archaeon]MDD2936292.1 ribonuclease Z [Candidatus Methanomethylophilaceae archaeon]MDD3351085.1 ribonuclease Z [Candidatus Methanomethylophilaceae archaeon]MDD3986314.1 ribonuclease Z [Candidatus Methanomethylophilaceae archaeon]MDD4708704.1 ribonuclease Z [Candidatus Methanomethylophilaceae archaeon]